MSHKGGYSLFFSKMYPYKYSSLCMPSTENVDSFKMIGAEDRKAKSNHLWEIWKSWRHISPWLNPHLKVQDTKPFDAFWSLALDRCRHKIEWKVSDFAAEERRSQKKGSYKYYNMLECLVQQQQGQQKFSVYWQIGMLMCSSWMKQEKFLRHTFSSLYLRQFPH